jgi:hypothetical protein
MFRRMMLAGVATALIVGSYSDVTACGDKFMRIGRSASGRQYAALHPSSILIYRPAGATTQGITDLETLLKRAGHTPRVLPRGESLPPVLATSNYALLIADYADVELLKKNLAGAPSQPAILPILLDGDKTIEVQARKEFHCLIKPRTMRPNDALVEIDHALDFRLKNASNGTR